MSGVKQTSVESYQGSCKNGPNYLASLEQELPPRRRNLSSERPDCAPRHLNPVERNTAVISALPLVGRVLRGLRAKGFPNTYDDEDIKQDGVVGLCDAAIRFDPYFWVRFETFARKRVEGEIIDSRRRFDGLAGEGRRHPTVVSQLNGTKARSLYSCVGNPTSNEGLTLEEVLPAKQPSTEEVAIERAEMSIVYEAMASLPLRQRRVLQLTAQDLSQPIIAQELAVSKRTVQRDLKAARAAIRAMLEPTLFD